MQQLNDPRMNKRQLQFFSQYGLDKQAPELPYKETDPPEVLQDFFTAAEKVGDMYFKSWWDALPGENENVVRKTEIIKGIYFILFGVILLFFFV